MKTTEEIERIVREVVRRVTSGHVHAICSPLPPGTLQVADRVITLSSIEGKLGGIQQLVVLPKAVVTPSVRDELTDKKVELVRQGSTGPKRIQTKRKLLLANLGTEDFSQVVDDLPCEVRTVRQDSLEAAIRNMTSQLANNSLGVIIADQPELAVCLANRSSNVRAFVGHGIESVRRAKMFAGNLMALDAASSSSSPLLTIFLS